MPAHIVISVSQLHQNLLEFFLKAVKAIGISIFYSLHLYRRYHIYLELFSE